jgi:hypothetical protein
LVRGNTGTVVIWKVMRNIGGNMGNGNGVDFGTSGDGRRDEG